MAEKVHKHWWSRWLPYDRSTIYRYCHGWRCDAVEKKKVTA